MTALAIVLGVIAAAAIVATIVLRRRLVSQRGLTTAAETQATTRSQELAATTTSLATAEHERTAAEERARAAEEGTTFAEERARTAEEELATVRQQLATLDGGLDNADAALLWDLERSRTTRTWHQSVAVDLDAEPELGEAHMRLVAALQVELDAAREDIGAVVELDADVPDDLPPRTSLFALRIAQEMLADVVRRAEETTLVVRVDGGDLVVTVAATDEAGTEVTPKPLSITATPLVESVAGGFRLRGATGGEER